MPTHLERLSTALAHRYTIERELGRGGMATVYLALDLKHRRQVAIKVLRPDLAAALGPKRFLREIEIAAKLNHPHILSLHDSGQADGFLFYVMPYVEGQSLRTRLNRERRLPIREAVDITRAVASALDCAHGQGIVHRDIKPENILLQQGEAVIADFGVAVAVSAAGDQRLTQAGMTVGTPEYLSPEQATGETTVDARSDIYALGCVVYEMLAGAPPFTGSTTRAVLAAQVTASAAPLLEVRPETPPRLSTAVAKALAKAPEDRFQTAAEFRDAVSVETLTATPPPPVRRRRLWVAGATAVVVLAAVAFLWSQASRAEADPRKSLIVFPFENRTGVSDNDWLEEAAMHGLGLTLAHWEELRVFDDERTASLMQRRDVGDAGALDFEAARRIAREAGVGTLVLGDVRREGDWLAIEAKVHDVRTGERLATEIVRGRPGADPRLLFDSLAARILRVSGAPPGERPGVVPQTTRSLEAYRAYLAGTAALHGFALDSAEAKFRNAIDLDSTFALAYLQLANVEGWRGGDRLAQRPVLVSRAEAHSGALPPRLRMLVQFYVAFENRQFPRARSIAEALIARDSGDVEAWYQLGEAHLHHGSGYGGQAPVPHPDTLGNLGKALGAFRRALALDSSYIVAHRHIVDALGDCARLRASWLCVGDSAVYAAPQELEQRFGRARVERLRQEAEDGQVEAAYAWVSAAPTTLVAREHLVQVLIGADRLDAAERQLPALERVAPGSNLPAYEMLGLLAGHHFGEAAERASEAAAAATDSQLALLTPPWMYLDDALVAGGHVHDYVDLVPRIIAGIPVDPVPLGLPPPAEDVAIPKSEFTQLLGVELLPLLLSGADSLTLSNADRELFDRRRRVFAGDSVAWRLFLARQVFNHVFVYLASGDSTVLSRVLDQLPEDSLPTARAHLALARGDTTEAERLRRRHYRPDQWRGTQLRKDRVLFAQAYFWATVLTALGDLEGATAAYNRLDNFGFRATNPTLLVLSWVERGKLYRALGDRDHAIEMYEKSIAAWDGGDDSVQWMVDKARAAVATLRGEPLPGRQR